MASTSQANINCPNDSDEHHTLSLSSVFKEDPSNAAINTDTTATIQDHVQDYHSLTEEAITAMRSKLPKYVVESFVASGFDTLDIISKMDVSSQDGNSLDAIEKFIAKEYPHDPRFYNYNTTFKFLPGHRIAIESFVAEIQAKIKKRGHDDQSCSLECSKKRKTTAKKKPKVHVDIVNNDWEENVAECVAAIRRNVAKWQRSKTIQAIRNLKEHQHFDINATNTPIGLSVTIVCLICGHSCKLGKKAEGFLLSNWTRHVDKCIKNQKKKSTSITLDSFFATNESATSHLLHLTPVTHSSLSLRSPPLESESNDPQNDFSDSDLTVHPFRMSPPVMTKLHTGGESFDNKAARTPLKQCLYVTSSNINSITNSLTPICSITNSSNQYSVTNSICSVTNSSNQYSVTNSLTPICSATNSSNQYSVTNSICSVTNSSNQYGVTNSICSVANSSNQYSVTNSICSVANSSNQYSVTNSTCSVTNSSNQYSVTNSICSVANSSNQQSVTNSTCSVTNSSNQYSVTNSICSVANYSSNQDSVILPLPCIDWSRSSRTKLSLLKAGSDPNQTKITDFFDVSNKVSMLLKQNEDLIKILENSTLSSSEKTSLTGSDVTSFLHKLMENASSNSHRIPKCRRYDEVLKKFGISLFIYAGPMSYKFVQSNMSNALPSLRTIQRKVNEDYVQICEGEFKFDGLLNHLTTYKSPLIVSIGEDATRIIARVDYDEKTNRLVGFVLPKDQTTGLPLTDTYLAITYEGILNHFVTGKLSRYAIVFIAQALALNVPPYVLACIGSDNCFKAENVLKIWTHIHNECRQRGIAVISYGADGDSREMSAMLSSTQLNGRCDHVELSPSFNLPSIRFHKNWYSWFQIRNPTETCYVQDTVDIGVKLKARLLQPSTVLPIGNYVAGAHHLHLLMDTYNKDQHGLRHKDVNHKDRQNYDAVLHITSEATIKLLSTFPDALGTKYYLVVMRAIIDSYLDKTLTPLQRVEKAWYAVFFYRYWKNYIIKSSTYTIKNNFISNNAYLCAELNAHAIIIFIVTLRDNYKSAKFMPWLLGSQSCEKTFRTVRSMSSTFSTIINFSLLSMLRRLHRLQIQLQLESEASKNGICYPRVETHNKKDGHQDATPDSVTTISDADILKAVNRAKIQAKQSMSELGISNECCDEATQLEDITDLSLDDNIDDIGDKEDIEQVDNCIELQEEILGENGMAYIEQDVMMLKEVNVLDENTSKLIKERRKKYSKIQPTGLPLYNCPEEGITSSSNDSLYVTINHNGQQVYVRKSTVVWLLTEGERLSNDRLFRVRNKQPFENIMEASKDDLKNLDCDCPFIATALTIGDICAFASENDTTIIIGKILQFAYFKEKTKKGREYKNKSVILEKNQKNNIGVLCTWYNVSEEVLIIQMETVNHSYYCLSKYLCTLPLACLQPINCCDDDITPTIMTSNISKPVMTSNKLILVGESMSLIKSILEERKKQVGVFTKEKVPSASNDKIWVKFGNYTLTIHDKCLVINDQWLTDIHMGFAQSIIKQQFPNINGLASTLTQMKKPLPLQDSVLQIIHIKNSHWGVITTIGCSLGVVKYYDSLYTTISSDVMNVIAHLMQFQEPEFTVEVMNVCRQVGTQDCALFAIDFITEIAFGNSPCQVKYEQSQLREHLIGCYEKKQMSLFPSKKRKVVNHVHKSETFEIYCNCRLPYDGRKMVCCDTCDKWFHISCLSSPPPNNDDPWYCSKCSTPSTINTST